jgi:molecular chaperone IbpA
MFDLLDSIGKSEATGYPPYNIERVDEDRYRITLAVAGFSERDLDVELHESTLKVVGAKPDQEDARAYLHQGIAGRGFERRFQLADHVKIDGASLVNGLLNIDLRREIPEAKKPRKIEINSSGAKVEVLKASNAA